MWTESVHLPVRRLESFHHRPAPCGFGRDLSGADRRTSAANGPLVEHEFHAIIAKSTGRPQRSFRPKAGLALDDTFEVLQMRRPSESGPTVSVNILAKFVVMEAIESVLMLIAGKIDYWIADMHAATHR